MNTIKIKKVNVQVHFYSNSTWGGSEVAFENTFKLLLMRMILAIGIETDVRVSKDGVLYAIHDDNLKNITGKNVKIHDLSSDDLDQILIRGKYNILGLKNYFKNFNDATFNLDSKNINSAKL